MKTRPIRSNSRLAWTLLAALVASATLGSCAYYNTFYVARKYYMKATLGEPYRADRTDSPDIQSLNKSIDFSKKLMANYPRSKWVDDAYLLWARGYLAKNDPLQAVTMLEDFSTRYPNSPLIGEAAFYRAVALRQARRYAEALTAFDEYLASSPKGELLPYAYLERARTLRSLDRPAEAAQAAGKLLDRWPKSKLAVAARIARADAHLARGAYEDARVDFHTLGSRSRTDDERLEYLLRESECLEAARRYDEALALLREALGHERPPQLPDTTGGRPLVVLQVPGYDRFGRLLTRIGTVQLMSGETDGALESYRRVVNAYPRTPVAAEAQYRIGYAFEIGADDFEGARAEYARVRDQNPGSPFVTQAAQRMTTLDQLSRFHTAGGDTVEKRAQGGLLLAEQYLFQLGKPERAIAEYARLAEENRDNPWGGKALNARAWVLLRKLDRPAEAESLWWRVVREYPATEAQLAARDYLEAMGQTVPSELIKLPPPPEPRRDTSATAPPPGPPARPGLTPVPTGEMRLGPGGKAAEDAASRAAASRAVFGVSPLAGGPLPAREPADSAAVEVAAAPDSVPGAAIPPGPGVESPGLPAAVPGLAPPPADSAAALAVVPPAAPAPADSAAALAVVPPAAPAPPDTLAAAAVADTARARVPLPPLELSPVRPGITFPSGRPRTYGLPERVEFRDPEPGRSGPRNAPLVIGAPPGTTPGATPAAADSLSAPAIPVVDSMRARPAPRGFEPRGSHFQ